MVRVVLNTLIIRIFNLFFGKGGYFLAVFMKNEAHSFRINLEQKYGLFHHLVKNNIDTKSTQKV